MHVISGAMQHYQWGSKSSIPALLKTETTGQPLAEYWLGTHPLGMAQLVDQPGHTLGELVSAHPEVIGQRSVARFGSHLPYMFKILAVERPMSLQAHPGPEQAADGFSREEHDGIPLDAPHRTFKDPHAKPELLVALTPFDALFGFRAPRHSAELFAQLPVTTSLDSIIGPLTERAGSAALAEVFLDVLSLEPERHHLVDEVVAAAMKVIDADGELGQFARTAVDLDEHFPGDPGLIAALLMNRIRLEPGQGIYVPAGRMHSHLRGMAVEVQGSSDNVLRGALTQKHIDVDGLISVVEFQSCTGQIIEPMGEDGIYFWDTPAEEFALWMLDPTDAGARDLPASDTGRIAFVAKGSFTFRDGDRQLQLGQGEAVFLAAGERLSVSGPGQLFVTSPGV